GRHPHLLPRRVARSPCIRELHLRSPRLSKSKRKHQKLEAGRRRVPSGQEKMSSPRYRIPLPTIAVDLSAPLLRPAEMPPPAPIAPPVGPHSRTSDSL